jgi:hypothetical protein
MKIFFMYFYYLFDKCVYIKNMYLLRILFIIWVIIKINMDECDVLRGWVVARTSVSRDWEVVRAGLRHAETIHSRLFGCQKDFGLVWEWICLVAHIYHFDEWTYTVVCAWFGDGWSCCYLLHELVRLPCECHTRFPKLPRIG